MTKKELVDYILLRKDDIDDYKSQIKGLESNISEESRELEKLMVVVEEKRKIIRDLSNNITKCKNWIDSELSDIKEHIENFGKGFPCAIEHEGKLIVVTNSNITIEENFIS